MMMMMEMQMQMEEVWLSSCTACLVFFSIQPLLSERGCDAKVRLHRRRQRVKASWFLVPVVPVAPAWGINKWNMHYDL